MRSDSDEFKKKDENQIEQWLKKLERESWQLELLVSAFTIFLLIQANTAFDNFLVDIPYRYKSGDTLISVLYVFAILLGLGIRALSVFLIIHLLLRGFWIGAIGLRSVQSKIDFSALNYSELFTKKLSKRVISLDKLVIFLDEICSVIFSFSFLIISMLIAFGTYLTALTFLGFIFDLIPDFSPEWLSEAIGYLGFASLLVMLLTGIIYLIDYFTLGFFKKIKWFSKFYYPFYRFYGFITFSAVSRSIYYYLISKFSKSKIRLIYLLALSILIFLIIIRIDHYQYFPTSDDHTVLASSYYDNLRGQEEYIDIVSISNNVIKGGFMQLFLRYEASDNELINSICPNHTPKKNDGINYNIIIKKHKQGGLLITNNDYEGEDNSKLLDCLSSIYQITINDSIYTNLSFYFHEHSVKDQKGLITMIPTDNFISGENKMIIEKLEEVNDDDEENTEGEDDEEEKFEMEEVAFIPFWFDSGK